MLLTSRSGIMVIHLDDSTGPISPGGGNTGNSMLTAGAGSARKCRIPLDRADPVIGDRLKTGSGNCGKCGNRRTRTRFVPQRLLEREDERRPRQGLHQPVCRWGEGRSRLSEGRDAIDVADEQDALFVDGRIAQPIRRRVARVFRPDLVELLGDALTTRFPFVLLAL